MYRRPKFLETLLEIRQEMAIEADYDVELFAEIARSGNRSSNSKWHVSEGLNTDLPDRNGIIPEVSTAIDN
ncbi:hypothetical protein BH10ACI2_BH10ACI2_08940 [soil metagenome]